MQFDNIKHLIKEKMYVVSNISLYFYMIYYTLYRKLTEN